MRAVLLAVIWVIISGFMANLLLTQYIEQAGASAMHGLSSLLLLFPLFSLFSPFDLKLVLILCRACLRSWAFLIGQQARKLGGAALAGF